ncbi:AIG2-like family protein [Tsuneonella dongtanensis]|uniref:AIG2-like family protein n=1 Tax=Tsuneonella dongtanensis TaxID=692370 RepID=A0A1B2AAP1_9SPHN|nr:gamma-glutamylcyclotransferase family protein [Tsuneonella dongtanensis]ANY19115.1 AIG2-like family protein [Tsuneonella dongtanensis]
MSRFLFFYGVLIGDIAPPPVQRLLAGIGPGRPATVTGTLYAVDDPAGAHPALVAGGGTVKGMLYAAGSVDLAALDAFEGEDYARTPVVAQCGGERIEAQAYLWIAPTDGLEPIPDGDFARWLSASGRPPIGH